MIKLYDLLSDGFGNKEDYNCAEKILYGSNLAYNMELPIEALKLSAGFGGGMGIEDTCGAVTGAMMVLSHFYVKIMAHESALIKEKTSEFIERYKTSMSTIKCDRLKDLSSTEEFKCASIILKSAEILDSMITEGR